MKKVHFTAHVFSTNVQKKKKMDDFLKISDLFTLNVFNIFFLFLAHSSLISYKVSQQSFHLTFKLLGVLICVEQL